MALSPAYLYQVSSYLLNFKQFETCRLNLYRHWIIIGSILTFVHKVHVSLISPLLTFKPRTLYAAPPEVKEF